MTLEYESGLLVHIHNSWSSPVKMRQMVVGGKDATIIYDDIEPTDKLKVYPHERLASGGLSKEDTLTDYRIGEVWIPKFSVREALAEVVEEFAGVCSGQRTPRVSHQFTIDITNTIVKANESLRLGGVKTAL
jgi:predicted dehydrogenase